MEHSSPTKRTAHDRMGIFAHFIFASRWLQLPIYIGLIIAQVIYACKFLKSLWHLVSNFSIMDENTIMIAVLNLIDSVGKTNHVAMYYPHLFPDFRPRHGFNGQNRVQHDA